MKKTLIPEDNSIESIKVRERIIREFYREWKEKNPSQRKFNLSLKEYINIRMVSIVETSEHAAPIIRKGILLDALFLPQQRGGGLHFHVMLCGRGLSTTHTHRPLTAYVLGAKIRTFFESAMTLPVFFRFSIHFSPGRGTRQSGGPDGRCSCFDYGSSASV